MMPTEIQASVLRRYLLGDLPETQQEEIEEQYFADAGQLDEVWATETQLIDDYVRGQLGRAERKQFEQYYLASQPHHERVALARMLLKAADATEVRSPVLEKAPSRWAQFWEALREPQLAWGMALALLLLVFAGGLKLLNDRAQLRAQLTAAQSAQQQAERAAAEQLAAARAQNEQLAAEQEKFRQAGQPPPASPPTTRPAIFSFVLSAGLLRGSGTPQTLKIPPGTQQVELRLRLEANDYPHYQVKLSSVEGEALWNRRQLKPRAGQLAVAVPAAKLQTGDYILTLSGVKADTVEEVNRYFFRVSQK